MRLVWGSRKFLCLVSPVVYASLCALKTAITTAVVNFEAVKLIYRAVAVAVWWARSGADSSAVGVHISSRE